MSEPAFRIEVDGDLELRVLGDADAETLFALVEANRAHLREWLPWVDATTSVENERAFIDSSAGAFQRHLLGFRGHVRPAFSLGIIERGTIVGMIGFVYADYSNGATEIGYWLAAEAEGHGIMSRACTALVDYAFNDLKFHRVEIRCETGNTRSAGVARRLGFALEGTLREAEWLYDHWVDHLVFAMLVQDWRRSDG